MGEEASQEDSKDAEEKEEKPVDGANEEEKKGDGEKQEQEKADDIKPSSPAILSVDINCPGCAQKIKRIILKSRGVEDVEVDMEGKQVTVKGLIDPQALCTKVERKTKKKARVISPILPTQEEPVMINAQASGEMRTVMLNVPMHCEPCALQLQKRILRMRGVQTAEADFATRKVTVTGTMDANKLVEYVYKRTRKQANIIPPPPSPPVKELEEKPAEGPEPEENKEEDKHEEGKEAEEKKEEDKHEEGKEAEEKKEVDKHEEGKETEEKKEEVKVEEGKEEEKTEEGNEEGKEEGGGEEEKKGEEDGTKEEEEEGKDNQEENGGGGEEEGKQMEQDDIAEKMVYNPPIYVIERVYAPQLFSDENPNACCIL